MTTPFTVLTEEEELFRQTIRDFAEREIAPRVDQMERDAHYDPEILPMLFDLGIMGVEIPEKYGGSGGSFFMSILAVEELARVDAAVAVLVDVQNTLVANAILRWANEPLQERVLSKLAQGSVGYLAL